MESWKDKGRRTPLAIFAGFITIVWCIGIMALSAFAHGQSDAISTWNWQPHLLMILFAGAGLYATGVRRLWKKAGVGRGVSVWESAAYFGGIFCLFVAAISPLDAVSGELFSVHMVQHLIIMMIAAPLLVLGKPLFVVLWALPQPLRRRVSMRWQTAENWHSGWRLISHPLVVWSIYAVTLWVWHIPTLYEAALHNQYVHDLQHTGFLLASVLFWWVLLSPVGRIKMDRGAGVLYVFTTSLHGTALGVFLALSPVPWYSYYERTVTAWNFTLLEDQQLAGLIMWMPACIIYICLAALVFTMWLREIESEDKRLVRHAAAHYGAGPRDASGSIRILGDLEEGTEK